MLFYIHREKLPQLLFPYKIYQQVSACYHSFLAVTQSLHSKVTPIINELHAEKLDEAFFLLVFRISFPASLLRCSPYADIQGTNKVPGQNTFLVIYSNSKELI